MCGRAVCTLAPEDICRSCGYKSKDGKWTQPKWKEPPGDKAKYYTSFNVAPGSHTPVLLHKQHASEVDPGDTEQPELDVTVACDWVVQPMKWGLVPHWHSGDPYRTGFNMINARSDGMLTKTSFKRPLESGQRCVILFDGYYEWQTAKDGKKQPYFIYFPDTQTDTDGEKVEVKMEHETTAPQSGASPPKRLLTLAGLFDIWRPKHGGEALYSYSIITVEAHNNLQWIHDRMPAILNGEDEVRRWLDPGSIPLSKVAELIRPVDCVLYHPVSSQVGSVKNNGPECIRKVDPKKSTPASKMMKAWLTGGQKSTTKHSSTESLTKRAAPDGATREEELGVKKQRKD